MSSRHCLQRAIHYWWWHHWCEICLQPLWMNCHWRNIDFNRKNCLSFAHLCLANYEKRSFNTCVVMKAVKIVSTTDGSLSQIAPLPSRPPETINWTKEWSNNITCSRHSGPKLLTRSPFDSLLVMSCHKDNVCQVSLLPLYYVRWQEEIKPQSKSDLQRKRKSAKYLHWFLLY